MIIRKLHLSNFRSFKEKTVGFSENTTVIIGPNASGKSNIIESLFLLSTGKSFRARIEEEMVNYEEEIARVKGAIVEVDNKERSGTNLEVVLTRGEITIGESPKKYEENLHAGKQVARKRLLINGVGKRLIDFAGTFRTVLFGPWDLGLVTEAPSVRRKFLDTVLSQVDREYRRASLSYEKGLRQRNKLLLGIREENLPRSLLLFWDKLLIKNGDYIARCRGEFIEFVNGANFQFPISNFQLEYDKSAISEARLEQYKDEEIAAASTLVGPHRDDFVFEIRNTRNVRRNTGYEKHNLASYGSRGEQRMGVLWLKLAELAYIEEVTKEKPTLLLDDIFSELDHEHRDIVFEAAKGQQTIITTADPHYIENFKKVEKINL
ncbi:MAG: replication and repair protein recF protein [Microgenomates group bacterium GW2011_GWC1_37_8]|uniref:DNA replication and repair protein RecF n=1 Tax=Candidatus Woesebacteria bacterium GW2011_GWB1_38_8 TaxID=1618570 RepID=A0A0G0L9B0_9BACT|nr:MAG: replication and repair protein recF protein [Microgenomates group bacterium GW2011_GWC1_37_8]KKQ84460.1 MAG: replication and repair protein RecF protein [Candidatus Woesebacteria bacterium GW2011_GWB1_38_8]